MKTVRIDGVIGWEVTVEDLRGALAQAGGEDLELRITSEGGSVFEAAAMAVALREYSGRIVARVEGLAASAAAGLVLEADEAEMPEDSWIMFHEARADVFGVDEAEARGIVERLETINDRIAAAFAEKTGEAPKDVRAALRDEIWLDGVAAGARGVVDRVLPAARIAARANWGRFVNVPEKLKKVDKRRPVCQNAAQRIGKRIGCNEITVVFVR